MSGDIADHERKILLEIPFKALKQILHGRSEPCIAHQFQVLHGIRATAEHQRDGGRFQGYQQIRGRYFFFGCDQSGHGNREIHIREERLRPKAQVASDMGGQAVARPGLLPQNVIDQRGEGQWDHFG